VVALRTRGFRIKLSSVFELEENARRDLEEIGRTYMPFGKFGPAHFPPRGVPIWDLPLEYLSWFATKGGFPKGRLGVLLQMIHQMKVEGLDSVFDPLRKKAGGRTQLRTPNRRDFEF
jgi:uncharacterized protein (DUF3820 family)